MIRTTSSLFSMQVIFERIYDSFYVMDHARVTLFDVQRRVRELCLIFYFPGSGIDLYDVMNEAYHNQVMLLFTMYTDETVEVQH